MSVQFNKTVGIACISMLLQIGVSSQSLNVPSTTSQDKASKSSDTSSLNNQSENLALVSDTSEKKAGGDVKAATSISGEPVEPKIGIKNPSINLKLAPSDSKVNERPFEKPDSGVLGQPKVFRATAYALKGRTRTGAYVRRGVIAADPRVLPLHSIVQVNAGKYSGVYTVHDTGGKIKGNIIDVWMPTNREARVFGRRKVKVQVIRYGKTNRSSER